MLRKILSITGAVVVLAVSPIGTAFAAGETESKSVSQTETVQASALAKPSSQVETTAASGSGLSATSRMISDAPQYAAYLSDAMENSQAGAQEISLDSQQLALCTGTAVKEEDSVRLEEGCYLQLTVSGKPGRYNLVIEYDPTPENTQNSTIAVWIDGKLPFSQAGSITLTRRWRDKQNSPKTDSQGNDISLPQEEIPFGERGWLKTTVSDSTGYTADPLQFELKDTSTVTLYGMQTAVRIHSIRLVPPEDMQSYAGYSASHADSRDAAQSLPTIEAENAAWKSDSTLLAKSDRTTPATTPSKGAEISYNMIGGTAWETAGSELAWNFTPEETGLYEIRLRCRQNYSQGFYSTRVLKIDGEIPFMEAGNIRFLYSRDWKIQTLSADDGTPYKFYFEKGHTYTLSLSVSLGDFGGLLEQASECVDSLNTIYRQLLMIMSASPDSYRDYNLDKLIPDTLDEMVRQADKLDEIADGIKKVSGMSGSDLVILQKLSVQLRSFHDESSNVAKNFSYFKSNISSLNDWIVDAANRPLDLDTLTIAAPGSRVPNADVGFLSRLWYGMKIFFASFINDYNSIRLSSSDSAEEITVWSTAGRDQASIYNNMFQSLYTPQSENSYGKKVGVNLQLVAQDTIMPSLAAGDGPDVLLSAAVNQPVDYALRKVACNLYDIAGKEEVGSVLSGFRESAYIPFELNGGVYAVPEQQSYLMMFYRSDILADLGIPAPTMDKPWTWDDVMNYLPVLQKNNMSVLMETGANANTSGLGSFAMLLYQRGGSFYNTDGISSALNSETAIDTFKFWTNLYNNNGLPSIFNIANRFRTGESPVVISDYSLYNTLAVSAPEIKGLWSMAMVPGFVRQDGTADYSTYSTSTGSVIMNDSKHKQAAWDFVKWWTGTDAQTYFGHQMESIMGTSARYAAANLKAIGNLAWSSQDYAVLMAQGQWAKAIPEVPGGYYLSRYVNNAFRAATRDSDRIDARESILTYTQVINNEVKQKRLEFGLPTE